ncbi:MAG: BrnA antitoxin family protein [Pseudomonadota bacterium]|nr:BrnA antitoxin family protein [Pseudomonadota bacterium]
MKSESSRSEKRPPVRRISTSTKSKIDWAGLRSANAPAPAKRHPEAEVRHIVRGAVRRGLQLQLPKSAISLRLDQDVLEWFKTQGPGYQTRINAVLRAFRDASV